MAIADDWSVAVNGDIRHPSGTAIYSVGEWEVYLQTAASQLVGAGDDLATLKLPLPCRLDGLRDAQVPARVTLLNGHNITDAQLPFLKFGSVRQAGGNEQFSGVKTIGNVVASTPIYVVQGGAKVTKFWPNGHIQILVRVKTGGSLIDSGLVSIYSRKYGQTFARAEADLSAGGESITAIATELDPNITLSLAAAAALSSKVTITTGDTTKDLNNGSGPKLYKGTITLSGGCTLVEAAHYLHYIMREDSAATIGGVPGWRFRGLSNYTPDDKYPIATISAGQLLLRQGWWLEGATSDAYALIADDGSTQVPAVIVAINAPNLEAGTRVQLFNVTDGVQIINTVLASPGLSYVQGWVADKTIRLRAAKLGKVDVSAIGVFTSGGLTFLNSQPADPVYAANGIDGSTVTDFTADEPNVQVDVSDPDGVSSVRALYAWFRYYETSALGIAGVMFGGIAAQDEANYIIDPALADIKLDNVTGSPVKFGDGYLARSDGSTVIASASGSVQMDPGKAYVAAGATPGDFLGAELESGYSVARALRIIAAAVAGKSSGGPAGFTARNLTDTADQISGAADPASGNRTSVTHGA
jgi:hypothetical protein